MGLDDKIRNKTEEAKGRVKENVGDMTDDERMQAEGRRDRAKGQAKQAGEHHKAAARDVKDTFQR